MTPVQQERADLITWLRWVLDQREAEARLLCALAGTDTHPAWLRDLLAEVNAKREIVEWCEASIIGFTDDGEKELARTVLKEMSKPYADRPGYREEWKPT